MRTLLVVSERPHPWAFLRDRLDPELVTVAWARPGGAGDLPAPWMLAGAGDDASAAAAASRNRLVCLRGVGPAPAGLPAAPTPCRDWHQVAAGVERALAVRLAGLRLAPGCGLVLPDGSYLPRAAGLEALLAPPPGGVWVEPPPLCVFLPPSPWSYALLRRHGVPLRVAWADGRLGLAEVAA